MRITNNMMMDNYLENLNKNLTNLTDRQRQVSSGKAINSLSDDPIALISIMNSRSKLSKNAEYAATVDAAQTWVKQTDTSVYQLNQLVQSAYETLVQASNDTFQSEDKLAAGEYIAQLRDQVLVIGNSQSNNKYLFGGYTVNNRPFTLDVDGNILYNGLKMADAANPALDEAGAESIVYEVGVGMTMGISVTGTELLGTGDDNIYSMLDNICQALNTDASADELGTYISKLQNCQTAVLNTESKVGGMMNRLDLLANRYEDEKLTYTDIKSKVEDVDIAEAYMNYVMADTVYNSALKVGTQVIQASILDYLK